MNKQDAIKIFGGVGKLAKALGIRSQSVSGWEDGPLPQRRVDEIVGAALRLGLYVEVKDVIDVGLHREEAA